MSHLWAQAIPQIEPPLEGIHVLWLGPKEFLFAPGGWQIERRVAAPFDRSNPVCESFTGTRLGILRKRLELRVSFGVVALRPGVFPGTPPPPAEIFTFDFDQPSNTASVLVRATRALIVAHYLGKPVAFSEITGSVVEFGPVTVDRIAVYTAEATLVQFCISDPLKWPASTPIKNLQLPLTELVPSLGGPAGEFAEAKSRMLPGESVDETRFHEVADILRSLLQGSGKRTIDKLLLMRTDVQADIEEMFALDPLRTLYSDPMWRRILGFAYFDQGPGLMEGTVYDYRISGGFPGGELSDNVYGFHTIPSQTQLPSEFYLHDCMFRFAAPVLVERAPGIPASGLAWCSRLGVQLTPAEPGLWAPAMIDDLSAVIDLPTPAQKVTLELDSGHQLRFQAGIAGGPMSVEQPVPSGEQVPLVFPSLVNQIRLSGKGFLFSVRVRRPGPVVADTISMILPGVRFVNTPRPEPPVSIRVIGLQRATQDPVAVRLRTVRPRHELGFEIRWQPAVKPGVTAWPVQEGAPLLDSASFELQRRIEPGGPFTPVEPGKTLILGDREPTPATRDVRPGANVMELFPEIPPQAQGTGEFSYIDVFRAPTEEEPERRLPPPPGTRLRYRARTIDVIGRPSATFCTSAITRLEKREPPPVPASPDERPAHELPGPAPTGVRARVLVRGGFLAPADAVLLGTSDNAIVLEWGWHAQQRQQDPFARQFRVYLAPALDDIPGEVITVTPLSGIPGGFRVRIQLSRRIAAGAAQGLALEAGYPFLIESHTAGLLITMRVRTRIPIRGGGFRRPALGKVRVPLRMASASAGASGWSERFLFPSGQAFLPITTANVYQAVLRDRLDLSEAHPRDAIWVGVSAADEEPYVSDTVANPGPQGPLPGNESPVAPVLCQGVRQLLPEFAPPLALAPVPRIMAPEPVDGPIQFALDLTASLTGSGLVSGERVQPERLSVDDLFEALAVVNQQIFGRVVSPRNNSETDREIFIANPTDRDTIVEAIESGDSERLQDQHAVFLAGRHFYGDRLFRLATTSPIALGPFPENLPPQAGRHLYRVRRAGTSGQLSLQGAMAKAVVRVPLLAPDPAPERLPREAGDPVTRLRFRVVDSGRSHRLLVFEHVATPDRSEGVAELLRTPNRHDLYPHDGIRLRVPNGDTLAPGVQDIASVPVSDGARVIPVDLLSAPDQRVLIWAVLLSDDGIPGLLGGPWSNKVVSA